MLKNYIKTAFRFILRHKVFSLINIFGLAISMAICLVTIQMIITMYKCDQFQENKDRIFRITSNTEGYEFATSPMPLAAVLEEEYPQIETALRIKNSFFEEAIYNNNIINVNGIYTDKEFFKMFSFDLESGNPATVLKDPNSLVLTKELAIKIFGNTNPTGEIIKMKNLGDFKVTGVIAESNKLITHLKFELLVSASSLTGLEKENRIMLSLNDWENFNDNYTYILFNDEISPTEIESLLLNTARQYYPDKEEIPIFHLQALTDISPGKNIANEFGAVIPGFILLIFSFLALIIILTACFNYTSLSIAKSLSRAKEIGIRKVNGAKRSQIFKQFVGEAVLICVIALNFAYIILQFLLPSLNNLHPDINNMELGKITIGIFIAFLLFSVVTGILAGLFPAIYMSKFKTATVLKDLTEVKIFSRLNLRKTLLAFQLFVSFVFIVTVITGFKQAIFLKNFDYGFNSENIINIQLQDGDYENYKQNISGYSNIINISASGGVPNTGSLSRTYIRMNNSNDTLPFVYLAVDRNFINNIELELIAGQNFPESVVTDNEKFIILNESALELFGFNSPSEAIGNFVSFKKYDLQIIGIVKDFSHVAVYQPIRPMSLRYLPEYYSYANVKVSSLETEETIKFLEEKWKELYPDISFRYEFFQDQIKASYKELSTMMSIITFVAFIAIMIAFLGLFGMVVYNTESRIKEIGIRKVMGAKVMDVIKLLSKSYVFLMVLAAAIGTPLAWFIGKLFIQNFIFKTKLGPGIYLLGLLFMLVIGIITILSQTLKAANRNPVDSLRYE